MKEPKRFFRYCITCGERFTPTGKYQMTCESCQKKIMDKVNAKKRIKWKKIIDSEMMQGGTK